VPLLLETVVRAVGILATVLFAKWRGNGSCYIILAFVSGVVQVILGVDGVHASAGQTVGPMQPLRPITGLRS